MADDLWIIEGRKLREVRVQGGFTVREAAAKFSITPTEYGEMERGKRAIPMGWIASMALHERERPPPRKCFAFDEVNGFVCGRDVDHEGEHMREEPAPTLLERCPGGSPYAEGETCGMCDEPATHKLGEEDPPERHDRHNLTQYVCCPCFTLVMGAAAPCPFDPGTYTNLLTARVSRYAMRYARIQGMKQERRRTGEGG